MSYALSLVFWIRTAALTATLVIPHVAQPLPSSLSLEHFRASGSLLLRQEGPFIESVRPGEAHCGQELDITVYGGGFAPGAEVGILADGVEVRYTEFISPQELRAGIVIYDDAAPGRWPVAVWGETGETSREGAFGIVCDSPVPGGEFANPDEGGFEPDAGGEEIGTGGGDSDTGGGWFPKWWWLALIGLAGGFGVLVTGGVALQVFSKSAQHKNWEKKAKQGDPPEPCKVSSWHCRVDEIEVELKRSKLTEIAVWAGEADSGRLRQEKTFRGGQVARLDRTLAACRLGWRAQEAHDALGETAGWLSGELVNWLADERSPQRASLQAHFEGVEVTCQFTLLRCVQKGAGTVWKKVDSWEVKRQSERDQPIGLVTIDLPVRAGIADRVAVSVLDLLTQFANLDASEFSERPTVVGRRSS